ncbi:S8 family serine peptidase [Streptomyces sp. NPDC088812]|uniref:S8 family serine peptidase n=1 Tax=Streptomyces sp. NPDC088812 TaxID=3365905 RepID=UPI00381D10D4
MIGRCGTRSDRTSDALPLIVEHTGDRTPRALAEAEGADVRHTLRSIDATAVEEQHDEAGAFWADIVRESATATKLESGLAKVWLDAPVETRDDVGNAQIGVPAARAAGYTGKGVKVAVLDTGWDHDHPDLDGAVVAERNLVADSDNADDDNGHGTHVAGIIAGSGAASDGRYEGVAPDASLLVGKVMDASGSGFSIAGMEWAVAQGADVVNMSLGTRLPSSGTDPLSQAVNTLSAQSEALFVASAGNSGPGASTVGAPAAADAALTVGAVDSTGAIASFSSRGPRLGNGSIKPDVTAPGVAVIAPRAKGTPVGDVDPEGPQGPVDDNYTALSGTSMAAPAAAGAVALLAQAHQDWDGERLKDALMSTAGPQPAQSVHVQGSGLVDVARGTSQPVTASPANINVGPFTWPHKAHPAETTTITYRNDADASVTLRIRPSSATPDLAAPPEGTLSLSATEITVPAHGTSTVDVTVDPSAGLPSTGGSYGWRLEATTSDGATRVETVLGAHFEEESYDVDLTALDRNGTTPLAPYQSTVVIDPLDRTGSSTSVLINSVKPEAHIRLPRGRYGLTALTTTVDPETKAATELTLESRPVVELDEDVAVRFDAREAKPASVGVPDDTVAPWFRDFGGQTTAVDSTGRRETSGFGVFTPHYSTTALSAVPTSAADRDDAYRYYYRTTLAAPADPGALADSPVYALVEDKQGGIPNRLSYEVPRRQLAKVDAFYGKRDGQRDGAARIISGFVGGQTSLITVVRNVPLAARRAEYYSADPDVSWTGILGNYMTPDGTSYYGLGHMASNPRTYKPGSTSKESWNYPVVGPALPANGEFLTRTGNRIAPALSLWGDSDPNHYNWNDRAFSQGTATLYRDGTVVGKLTSPWPDEASFDNLDEYWTVPGDAADYRLEVSASRDTSWHGARSQRIEAGWTFRSASTDTTAPLPLTVLRFQPPTDPNGVAPAGKSFTIPFAVQQQGPRSKQGVASLTVEVSYDEGATWTRVPTKVRGTAGQSVVTHPAAPSGSGWVSLRASGEDHSGNAFRQTVIRAYRVG